MKHTRRVMAACALAAVTVCRSIGAPPDAADAELARLIAEIDALRSHLHGPAQPERDSAEGRLAAALRKVVESAPADDRAPTWMLDLAALELDAIARQCDDASALFGVPTPAQIARVERAARLAATLIDRAESAAQSVIARLEAQLLQPGIDRAAAAAIAARNEPTLTRLVDAELGARIPLLRADAAALVAVTSREPAVSTQARAEAMPLIARAPSPGLREEVHKRLLTAALLVRSPDAQQRESARRQLEWILGNAASNPATPDTSSLSNADWVRLQMALIRCGQTVAAAKAPCPGRGEDWLVDLLLAESRLSAARSAPAGATSAGTSVLVPALAQILAVVDKYTGADDLDATGDPSPLRRLVYDKIGSITAPGLAWSSLDPQVALARAWSLRAEDGQLDSEAGALLMQVAGRADASPQLRARALWMLAANTPAAPAQADPVASPFLLRLVRELPNTRLAMAAAERIVDASPVREVPASCTIAWPTESARADCAEALRLLVRADTSSEALAYRLIATLLSGPAAPTVGELEQASAVYARLSAAPVVLRTRAEACLADAFDRALSTPQDPVNRDTTLRLAADFFAGRGSDGPRRSLELTLDRADAALAARLRPPDRIAAELRPLLGSALDVSSTPDRARLRLLLGVALRAAGELPASLELLRTVADEYEPDARATDPARARARIAFWNAWAELIEIVRSGSSAPAHADDAERVRNAQRYRERLELLDPNLGGEPWAGRIRAAAGGISK